jgi:methanogenic corrinoid protein MtbC1
MDINAIQTQFSNFTIQRKYKDAMNFIDSLILQKMPPQQIMTDVISKTLQGLQKFDESPEASGYSSLTLLAIARICDDAIKKLLLLMVNAEKKKGTTVIGTPLNDFHGLGKTIISAFLRSYGWEVFDLGLNVESKMFISEAQRVNADFILVSAFLLPSALRCKEIADLLHTSPIKNNVKLVVGGPPFKFHLGLSQKLGCDAYGIDAFDMIRVLNQLKGFDTDATKKIEKTSRFSKIKLRIFGALRRNDSK